MLNIGKAQKMKNVYFIFLIISIHMYDVLHVLIKYTSQSLPWTLSPSSQYFPFQFLCLFLKSLISLYTVCMYIVLGPIKHGWYVKGSIAERNLTLFPAVINKHLSQGLLEALLISHLGYSVALSCASLIHLYT